MYEDPTPTDWSMNIASRSLVHLCGLGRKLPSTLITRDLVGKFNGVFNPRVTQTVLIWIKSHPRPRFRSRMLRLVLLK